MSIKIIGAGLGRTGTTSLKAALEHLGFGPCYHMLEIFTHPEYGKNWIDLSKGKKVDWDTVFKGYNSTVDYPSCIYYKDQMAYYPDAKVILTVRDPEKWYESGSETIFSVGPKPLQMLTIPFMALASARVRQILGVLKMAGSSLKNHFDGRLKDKEYTIAKFKAWNEEVKKTVPPEKLLVFEVKEGWEPLCKFLGVPVPQGIPFPHVNERAEFKEKTKNPFSRKRPKFEGVQTA